MFDSKPYIKIMAPLLLMYTEILKIVNTSFGNLPRSGLLEQGAEADRYFAGAYSGSLALTLASLIRHNEY